MLIARDSRLRNPPSNLSREQVLILDGLRYSVEMADLAYERLAGELQKWAMAISGSSNPPRITSRRVARYMLDAWSIVDSVHRFVDLASNVPGVTQGPWLRLLQGRAEEALTLRNDVQHQLGAVQALASGGGQLWGYLSWAAVDRGGKYTGEWFMVSPGSTYTGDSFWVAGPATLPFPIRLGHIRLNAFDRGVYLSRVLDAIVEAIRYIAYELANGRVKPVGPPVGDDRGAAEVMMSGFVEVAAVSPPPSRP